MSELDVEGYEDDLILHGIDLRSESKKSKSVRGHVEMLVMNQV